MSRVVLTAALSFLLLLRHGHAASGEEQPFELVRTLQVMQSQIAHGVRNAHAAQRAMLFTILKTISSAPPTTWNEPRNQRALLSFVLSGGDPRPFRDLLAQNALGDLNGDLAKGVLAFGEGRSAEAQKLLDGVDARSLDPSIAGHIALVQGIVNARDDPGKATSRYDDAELLAPGTLVEEAALRRNSVLLLESGNVRRGLLLSSRYLRRFPKSSYGDSFLQTFAAAAIRIDADDAAQLAAMDAALEEAPASRRSDFYILIAREAVLRGKVKLTLYASEKATTTTASLRVKARAKLYEAVALVAGKEWERGRSLLQSMAQERFEAGDAELRRAALDLAEAIRRPPEQASAINQDVVVNSGAGESTAMKRAQHALTAAQTLIEEAQ